MHIDRPDPRFTSSRRARSNFSLALRMALLAVAVLWFILLADTMLGLDLARFGLRPREWRGLLGVLTAPLLHADAEHLFANSLPLIIALSAMLYLYPNSATRVIPLVWIGGGLLAWLIGRPSIHIGASGLVYGLLAYVFVGGVLRRDMRSVGASLMVWFLYGSMVWGVLPIRAHMSWEMHLAGAVMGVGLAVWFRAWDRAPVVRYSWEDEREDEVPDWFPDDDVPPEGDPDLEPGNEPLPPQEWKRGDGKDREKGDAASAGNDDPLTRPDHRPRRGDGSS